VDECKALPLRSHDGVGARRTEAQHPAQCCCRSHRRGVVSQVEIEAIYINMVSSAEAVGAFQTGFETGNMHRHTEAWELAAASRARLTMAEEPGLDHRSVASAI